MIRYLALIGIGFIFLGIILIVVSSLISAEKGETKAAVGGIIGFIPFGFANDKKLLYFVIGLTAIMFFVWILFNILR